MALEFLDKAGVSQFSTEFLKTANSKIQNYISTAALSSNSDDNIVASAKAVSSAIKTFIESEAHLSFDTVTGDINSVEDPDPTKIYLQKEESGSSIWTLYIYVVDKWVPIGDISVDLVRYWANSKEDNTILQEELNINKLVDSLDALKGVFESHMATGILTTDITSIMENMANETNTFKEANLETPSDLGIVKASVGESDGQITGVSIAMEYSRDKIVWITCVGDSILNLAPGKYYVRYKSTPTKKASAAVQITVASETA